MFYILDSFLVFIENHLISTFLFHLLLQLPQLFNHNLVIIPLLEPTYHDDGNRAIASLDKNWYSTPVNRIVLGRLSQSQLRLERLLITTILVLQPPCAGLEADDGRALAGHPEIVVKSRAGVGYLLWGVSGIHADYPTELTKSSWIAGKTKKCMVFIGVGGTGRHTAWNSTCGGVLIVEMCTTAGRSCVNRRVRRL